jgi:hypothetical protein
MVSRKDKYQEGDEEQSSEGTPTPLFFCVIDFECMSAPVFTKLEIEATRLITRHKESRMGQMPGQR